MALGLARGFSTQAVSNAVIFLRRFILLDPNRTVFLLASLKLLLVLDLKTCDA